MNIPNKNALKITILLFIMLTAMATTLFSYSVPVFAGQEVSFTGTWKTSWGPVTLSQAGNKVSGTYTGSFSGKIEGDVEGNRLKFKWVQPNGEWGKGYFDMASDGKSFKGKWGGYESDNDGGAWDGTKI